MIIQEKLYKPFRFALVGVLATFFYFAFSFSLNIFVLDSPMLSHFIAYGLCIPLSYYFQQGFTFKYEGVHKIALPKFILVNISGFIFGALIVAYIERLGHHPLWGTAIICFTIPIINYILFDLWVFKNRK